MQRHLSLILCGLILTSSFSFEVFAKTTLNLDDYLDQAQSKKLSYLPIYIMDRKKACHGYLGVERDQCLQEVVSRAEETLACPTSIKRFQEGVEHDDLLAADSFLKNGSVKIPENIQQIFTKVQMAALKLFKSPFPIQIELAAYKSSLRNAHAAVGGKIFMTDGLWKGEEPFSDLEIAAILAHELAHVVEAHGMGLNCMALEWIGTEMTVHEAQKSFFEDFRGGERFEIWSAYSQSLEFAADRAAVRILKEAGLDPLLMARALDRLRPKSTGGFSSGSHPEFDVRVEAARKAGGEALAK